ncbi:MAG: AraC family transcriptional regulator [Roseburia sp.]|jgi:two-component system response regulator YesN|nr:AraC family transcriptional regulator [Roseburia sp.]
MRLLIVNDAIPVTESMKEDIEWKRYGIDDVLTAYNVDEAKAAIGKQRIDVLLCDIEMPGQNGLELIRWIRKSQLDIECILLTCHADFSYARDAVALGCQDYLLIPASYEDIGAVVQKVVSRCLEKDEHRQLMEYGKNWLHDQQAIVSAPAESMRSPKESVEECVSYLMQYLTREELSVQEIAAHCCLSPIYLNRIFKKEKGISISQYIIREKMALAARLLEHPASQASVVANQVGYPNYSYFSATFKKYYGCTPSQYREQFGKQG